LAMKLVLILGGAMGIFLYSIGWAFATRISDEGLRGPNMWGLRRTIQWDEIGSVRRIAEKGVPCLLIRSRSSKKQIWFCIFGLKEVAVLERLQAFIHAGDASTRLRKSEENGRRPV